MRRLYISMISAVALLALCVPSIDGQNSNLPKPPFHQCPPVGADTSCGVLIVFNPAGTPSILYDSSQGPFDTLDDTLVGIQNNSNRPVFSILISSSAPVFAFDGDGMCGISSITGQPYSPAPSGCPYYTGPGATGYEGPGVTFTILSNFSGRVNFPSGLAPSESSFFSLEASDFTLNSCGSGGAVKSEQITTFGSCPSSIATTPTWGQFGATQTLVAASGEKLQLICTPQPNYPAFELLYTPVGTTQSFIVGAGPFEGSCSSGWFSHPASDSGSQPSCFVETNWTAKDYSVNDIPNPWTEAAHVNTTADEPVLDWAIADFNVLSNDLTKVDQEYKYAIGPPVPMTYCGASAGGTPEGSFKKQIDLGDPSLQSAQAFFSRAVQNLQTLPPGGPPMMADPLNLADLDRNGKLTTNDFLIFLKAFGSCKGSASYNPAADYDADGCVTFKDYQAFLQFFNAK